MAHDDGSNEALVTPDNVLEQVTALNQIWRPARIQIKFDPMDFVTRRNTALNLLNPTKNSHVDNAFEIESALALGDEFLDKIVVIYRKSKAYTSDYYQCGPGFLLLMTIKAEKITMLSCQSLIQVRLHF
jgi:hypothetical protein